MKIESLIGSLTVSIVVVQSVQAQGTLQNLDFESATLTAIPSGQYGGEVPLGAALPGWDASIGGVPVTQVLQNNITLGAASIDILGPNWTTLGPGIIDGNYTLFLQAENSGQGKVSLWQDGLVPANAKSIHFSAWESLSTAIFSVSFAGNSLSPVVLGFGQSVAGQTYTISTVPI